jgi:DNA-binding IclR family transcriptional regulator
VGETSVPLNGTPSDPTYLGRLLDTIEMVTGGAPASSFRHAARLLGVSPSTAHRLLTLLLERGYCDRADNGAFRAGPRLLSIGMQALDQLPHWGAATAVVAELGKATGESASFGLIIGDEIVLIARYNSTHPLTAVATVGDVSSPHTSALGKVVLANVSLNLRRRLVQKFELGEADKVLASLQTELSDTARRGYGVDEEVFTPGMRCRAVPVFDKKSVLLGGLSVSGPSVRFTFETAESLIPLLKDAAGRLFTRPRPPTQASSRLRLSQVQPAMYELSPQRARREWTQNA